jgi:predicted Ser/Thr protein kinase
MDDFRKIKVYPGKKGVNFHNPTSFKFIGRGYSGAVFKISEDKCVKIFLKRKSATTEAWALNKGAETGFFPKLYEAGPDYVVMEYIKGPDLYTYLKKRGELPNHIAEQMLNCLKAIKRLGFTRLNIHLRHFIVTEDENLKLIDHAHALKDISTKPKYLLKKLDKLGLKDDFLTYVKKTDEKTYKQWMR